jgi:hypothetical protein
MKDDSLLVDPLTVADYFCDHQGVDSPLLGSLGGMLGELHVGIMLRFHFIVFIKKQKLASPSYHPSTHLFISLSSTKEYVHIVMDLQSEIYFHENARAKGGVLFCPFIFFTILHSFLFWTYSGFPFQVLGCSAPCGLSSAIRGMKKTARPVLF